MISVGLRARYRNLAMKLHVETVAHGFPSRWAYVLHGVFGSSANWRLFMRKVAEECPEWGFALVDQRGHAKSQGGEAPHTIDAMAADLLETEVEVPGPVAGVIGHSLGGKVALAYAGHKRGVLDRVWVLDSQPGTRRAEGPSVTGEVLELLEGLPSRFDRRPDFVRALTDAGQPEGIAAWLAMNLARGDDGYRLQLDLPAIRQILADFWRSDRWDELAAEDPRRTVHVAVGTASFVWNEADRARLEELPVEVLTLEGAGHWVHVDAAEPLHEAIVASLQ